METCEGQDGEPAGRSLDDSRPALELLAAAPIEHIEEVVVRLKKKRSAAEICDAMMKLIALAPLSEFQMLRSIYRRHCVPACK
jgi:hypothetical protein